MKIKPHLCLCRPQRDKTVNESVVLQFGTMDIERYESSDSCNKFQYRMNGMEIFFRFVNVSDQISMERL